jgi:hypothetical protein
MMSEYPEHEKLDIIKDKSQVIGEFLEWLENEKEHYICYYEDNDPDEHDGYYPINEDNDDLLAEFFNIDRKKLEEEKDKMLEEMRKLGNTES